MTQLRAQVEHAIRNHWIHAGMPSDKDALERIQAATDYPLQRLDDGWIAGQFFHCRLSSAFQPIYDVSRCEVIGHDAVLRTETLNPEAAGTSDPSPWGVFALAAEDPLLVRLDRLCRTIHVLNYFSRARSKDIMFATVQARLLESVKDGHGRAFERILDVIDVETNRVVIEIPASIHRDDRLLRHVISNYRSRGYKIACSFDERLHIHDLGNLYPEFIRMDINAVRHWVVSQAVIDRIHRSGARVLISGVENLEDSVAAIWAGADLLQGRFLGEPARQVASLRREAESALRHSGSPW
jgi:EAL domain-containing protein (putative c-di-GMP-specific phosphodiesterase class I)